jgi:hypothetical protein
VVGAAGAGTWGQTLEVTFGELIPGQKGPLLKRTRELSREQAMRIWQQKQQQGWRACSPQWTQPATLRPY